VTSIARFLDLISGFEGKLFIYGGMSCIMKTILNIINRLRIWVGGCVGGWDAIMWTIRRWVFLKDAAFITV